MTRPRPAPPPDPMVPRVLRVRRRRRETGDVVTLEIDETSAHAPRWTPGQFNMLYVFGVGEVPISVAGDAARPDRLVHTVRAAGSVTRVLARLPRGAAIGVRGPYGRGWPVDRAVGKHLVIVAGGLGLAPLRPVILDALARRGELRGISLLYGARTPEDLLFRRELSLWERRGVRVEVTVDSAGRGWGGAVGVVTKLVARTRLDPASALAFVCGPEVMMRFVVRELAERGVESARIFASMERNMKCAIGLCGHCQFGPTFICKDGPVFAWPEIGPFIGHREV